MLAEEQTVPEWDRFKFDDGWELATVRHIAHVPSARRIIEDGRIKAGLVYDQSRLNKSRISVAWVSANTWSLGSIYGTVEFQFSWDELVGLQNIYWIEAITHYRPPAFRLLLSSRKIQSELITPYDPVKDQGPLRYKDGKWYWNGRFTSEFMIEDDLSLDRCTGLDFVRHNADICGPFGSECEDRQKQPSPWRTGGRILSFILGNNLHVLDKHLKPPGANLTWLDSAYDNLEDLLSQNVSFAGPIRGSKCEDVVRGSLALHGAGQVDQAQKLLAVISSEDNFIKALKAIVRGHFDDPTWDRTEPTF
jgi:hypothetical protein